MFIKFETKSSRVKGLAFHPKRHWILVSLHNGNIQLWDYSEKILIDLFDEHKGPVRGLDFHRHQPLFVSGGDDAKIKVWNYKFRRCLFTLDAHEDYIRSTFFHQEHPWIVSASDDQSIRIWNWQSRSRIAVLTGHTHYIMCAQFHSSKELILSASIDQTLRLWDISGLKMKNKSKSNSNRDEIVTGFPEIMSRTDYSVESKEAHNSEINWCAFHNDPNKQLCLSAGDDNYIKVWKIDGRNSLRELDTLRGHYNNVSCATFVTINGKDIIISVSEDKTIKIWDVDKRCAISTHRRETDRFWTCAAHPTENLFAAGHDSGLLLMKVKKERPAFKQVKDIILCIKGGQIVKYNIRTKDETAITKLNNLSQLTQYHHAIDCYSYEDKQSSILTTVRCNGNKDKSFCEVYNTSNGHFGSRETTTDGQKISALNALFIGSNKLVILDHSQMVYFRINGSNRKPKTPIEAEDIYDAGPGRLFIKHKTAGQSTISLWDIEKGCAIASVKMNVKFIVANEQRNYVACVSSKKITICDGQLRVLSTIDETRKIKSAIWEANDVLIYNTPVQLKYALIDGETTAIQTLNKTLYMVTIKNDIIICLDRKCQFRTLNLDSRELRFKQAVIRNDRASILNTIRKLGQLSRFELQFLVKKGHPGLALKFVDDHPTRLQLALKAFDVQEALKSATKINSTTCWSQLAEMALKVGNVEAVEQAYKKLNQPYKLATLYLVTDQRDKMYEVRDMASRLHQTSAEFIISLMLKDFPHCVQILRRCGYHNLAYLSALNHNLHDLASEIQSEGHIDESDMDKLQRKSEVLKESANPLEKSIPELGNLKFENWPLLNDDHDSFKDINIIAAGGNEVNDSLEEFNDADGGDWDEFEDLSTSSQADNVDRFKDDQRRSKKQDEQDEEGSDGWQDDDEPLEDLLDDEDLEILGDDDNDIVDDKFGHKGKLDKRLSDKGQFVCPMMGQSLATKWIQISDVPLHHILAGSYRTAINLLQRQIGLIGVSSQLREIIRDLVMQSKIATRSLELLPTIYTYPSTNDGSDGEDLDGHLALPSGGYRIEYLDKCLNECYSLFSGGKFSESIEKFRSLLLSSIFVDANQVSFDQSDVDPVKRAKDLIGICREYILSLQIWLERKNITGKSDEENKRSCELAAYFSKLNLPKHRTKVLEKAFEVFIAKPKEYQKTRAASSIARRLLDLLPSDDPKKEKIIAYAKRVKASFDPQIDQQLKLAFDDLNPYSICASTFTPIYTGNNLVECPLCDAKYKPEFVNSMCKVCLISQVGKSCTGIHYKLDISKSNNKSDVDEEAESYGYLS